MHAVIPRLGELSVTWSRHYTFVRLPDWQRELGELVIWFGRVEFVWTAHNHSREGVGEDIRRQEGERSERHGSTEEGKPARLWVLDTRD